MEVPLCATLLFLKNVTVRRHRTGFPASTVYNSHNNYNDEDDDDDGDDDDQQLVNKGLKF